MARELWAVLSGVLAALRERVLYAAVMTVAALGTAVWLRRARG